ncbi:MAG: extracellular solute-binding protein [Oscillospiraceae bacterium]|nr:extracellular solute-binding protein [Oscillospiraceae bacterium]
MKTTRKKILALALSLCLLLSLAACGKDGEKQEDGGAQLSGTVYVPQFMNINIDLGKNGDIRQGCTDGNNVYVMAVAYPDWEAGEEGDTRYEIYRMSVDGGEPEKLENFQLPPAPEGFDYASSYADGLRAGAEGTLWVGVSINAYKYDLPEDFDSETDDIWNYEMVENIRSEYQVQLDSTGNTIAQVETTDLAEKAGMEYIYSGSMLFDKDGDLYVGGDGKIVVLDPSMNVRFTLEDDSLWGDNMVLLSDGTVGARLTISDMTTDSYSRQLRVIDKSAKNWGAGYELPANAYQLYSGGGDYLFYYQSGDTIYGFKEGGEEGEKLLSWLDSDINADEVEFFSFLPDGRLVVMTQSWDWRSNDRTQLAVLTATDRSEIPEKTIFTYATTYLSQDERGRILDFNKTNQTYRIEVKDYSEYRTDDNYMAGVQKLNTEIIAGNVPDIINVSNLPIRQYGAKGYLEDLWPYIDSDPDLGRDKLMERVFTAAEQDGKLYQIFDEFSISTIAGATSVVGDRMNWTLEDLKAALATMPDGCSIFSESDTKDDMLTYVVMMNLDSFLDWDNGECHFDSPEFMSLLEFCNNFPAEYDWQAHSGDDYDDEPSRVAEGRQMLMNENVSNFQDIQMHKAIFGGSVSYIGFPMENGSVGSCFSAYSGLAMSSTCKDKEGAWSFLREILLPQHADGDESDLWDLGNFPTNKQDFEWYAKQSMIPAGYETDENGNRVLDEDGNPIEISHWGWGWGSVQIDVYATKQEEYDQIMALYNAVDRMSSSDESIMEIVKDVAGSYFAGDRNLEDTAAQIQNRASLYVNEQR